MNRFVRGALAVFLGLSLMLPLGSFGWASESDELAPNETLPDETMVLDEDDALFAAPLLLDEPVLEEEALGDELIEDAESDVEVTPGWNAFGTCEWQIDDAGCLTIRPAGNGVEGQLPIIKDLHDGDSFPWIEDDPSQITLAKIEGHIKASNSLREMFRDCSKMAQVEGLHNIDMSSVKSMRAMFYRCRSLNALDLSALDTSNVEDMSFMFESIPFVSLDFSSFDTSNATNMYGMFWNCRYLKELNISSFDTSKVDNMCYMFSNCSSLQEIDLTNFDTSNVWAMNSMFEGCSSLSSLELNSFNTSKVKTMSGMFQNCRSLEEIDLSHFDTSNVKLMGISINQGGMFEGCISLKELDLSNFRTPKLESAGRMFFGCSQLSKLSLPFFDTSNITVWGGDGGGMHEMFKGCTSLRTLDLSSFDTSSVPSDSAGRLGLFDDTLCEITVGEKFTLQKEFPQVKWTNTKGQQFYPADIPVGVADTYTSTAPHVSIKVFEGASTVLEVGSVLLLDADVTPSMLASSLVWSSSDASVASVDGTGKVSAKAAGTAIISARAGDLSDSITVTVKAAGVPEIFVESVTLDKTSMTLVGQEMRSLSATVLPVNATYQNVVWSSSNENVARVSAQGAVTATGKGSATITARSADGKKSATCAVEVSNPVTWAGFSSVPTKVYVSKDYGIEITVRGDLPGETDGFTSVAWSSSDDTIAEVTGSGTVGSVRGVAPGSCAIQASAVRDGKTFDMTEQIEVEWDLIENITLSETSKSVEVGSGSFTLEYGISNPSAAGRLGEVK